MVNFYLYSETETVKLISTDVVGFPARLTCCWPQIKFTISTKLLKSGTCSSWNFNKTTSTFIWTLQCTHWILNGCPYIPYQTPSGSGSVPSRTCSVPCCLSHNMGSFFTICYQLIILVFLYVFVHGQRTTNNCMMCTVFCSANEGVPFGSVRFSSLPSHLTHPDV